MDEIKMEECIKNRKILFDYFKDCKNMMLAIGDETRQDIILTLLDAEKMGLRVGEITSKTHLSRPAVSHHLKILKEANIISMRKEGTKNYYSVNGNESDWKKLQNLVNFVCEVIEKINYGE